MIDLRSARTALAILLLAACGGRETEAEPAASPPLDVEVAGCAEMERGPVCRLGGDRALVLWTELPAGTPVLIELDGEPVAVSQDFVEGGVQLRLSVPDDARGLRVRAEGAGTFEIAIADAREIAALEPAIEARDDGDFEEAERRLEGPLASTDSEVRARALSLAARLAYAQGDVDRALERLSESSAALEREGALASAAKDRLMATVLLMHERWRFHDAAAKLDHAAETGRQVPEIRARVTYYRGRLATMLADHLYALDRLDESRQNAARLGMSELATHATQQSALVLQRLGRTDEALAALDGETPSEPGCARADHLTAVGWTRLLAREGRARLRGPIHDPVPPLREALRVYESACPRAFELGNAQLNLALAALQVEDIGAARERLASARQHLPAQSATLRAWELEASARAALASGQTEHAIATWRELRTRAELALDTTFEWRASYGTALAHRDRKSVV